MYEWFQKAEEGDLNYITQLVEKDKHVIDVKWDGRGCYPQTFVNEFADMILILPYTISFLTVANYRYININKSLLEFAANTGKTDVALYLIREGANTNNNFLKIALTNGYGEFVEKCIALLLEREKEAFKREIETINHGIEATKQAEQKTKADAIESILKNYQQSYDAQYKPLLIKNKQVIEKLNDLTQNVDLASIKAATSELRELDNIRVQLSTHNQALVDTLNKLVDCLVGTDRKPIQSLFQQFKPRIRELQARKKELINVINEFKIKDIEFRVFNTENMFSYDLNGCDKLADENKELLNKLDLSEGRIDNTVDIKKKVRSNCERIKREFEKNTAYFKEIELDPLFNNSHRHLLPASIQRSVQKIKDTINKLTQINNEVEIQYQEAFGDINEQLNQFHQVVDSPLGEDWTTLYVNFGKLHDQFKNIAYTQILSESHLILEKPNKPIDIKQMTAIRNGIKNHLDLINAILDQAYALCINADDKLFARINSPLENMYNERDKLKKAYDDLQFNIAPTQLQPTASALLISSIIEYAGLLKGNFKLETDESSTEKFYNYSSSSAKAISPLIDSYNLISDDAETSFTKLYFNKVRIKRIIQGIKSNGYLGQCDQCLSELSLILSPPQWLQQRNEIEKSNEHDRLNQLRTLRGKIREMFYLLENKLNHINKFINDKSKHLYHLELKYSNDKLDILLTLSNYKQMLNAAYNRANNAIAVHSMQANLKDTNTDAPVLTTPPVSASANITKETTPIAERKPLPNTTPTTANKTKEAIIDSHPTNPGSNSAGLFHQTVIPGLCFDRAVNLGPRAAFVRFALDHAAEESFRNFLAPEIKIAAYLVSDSESALPAIMRNAEWQQIIENYDLAVRNMQPAINLCCDVLGYLEGRRLNIDELKTFFTQANHQSRFQAEYQQLLQAERTILTPAETQLNDYARRIDIYRGYVTHYYGMDGWFVFNNTFTGESKTSSMIDIAAKFLNKKIEIYTNNLKVYETAVYGSEVVTVDYNGQNHFTPRVSQSNANQPRMTLK